MRQILMIAYYFPPFGGAGVQRSLKFAKYLPEFGWLPVVLSAKPPVHHLRDETLLAEIPIGVQVQRVDTLHLPLGLPWRVRNLITRWVLMVDEQIGWLPYALPAARRLLKAQNIRVIFTTSAPYSAHLIGYWLKSKYNLTWIADFRDPWIDNFNYVFPTLLHRRFAKSLERRILSRADLVTVASESMRLTILDRYPQLSPDNVVTITNGFDPSDFEGNTPVAHDSTRFQITYTGSFYAKKLTPDDFLRCLRQLIDLGQDAALVQRLQHRPVAADALAHLSPPVAGHQRLRVRGEEIVDVVELLDADLQHIAEALRGQQRRTRAAPLDQRVGHERGAVDDLGDLTWLDAGQLQQLAPALEHRACRTLGVGEYLMYSRHSPLRDVEERQIGKRAPNIDADGVPWRGHVSSLLSPGRPRGLDDGAGLRRPFLPPSAAFANGCGGNARQRRAGRSPVNTNYLATCPTRYETGDVLTRSSRAGTGCCAPCSTGR